MSTFQGNDILLSSKMISIDTTITSPITLSQSGSGDLTIRFNYNTNQFNVDTSNVISIKSIAESCVEGLSTRLESFNSSIGVINNNLQGLVGSIETIQGDVNDAKGRLTTVENQVQELERGSVDLSNYVATNGIKLTASGTAGIALNTTNANATVTVNNKVVATTDLLNSYQVTSDKNKANGYAGLDANSKISTEQLPIDSNYIIINNSKLTLDSSKVSLLDTNGKVQSTQIPIGNGLNISDNKIVIDSSKVATLNSSGQIDRSLLGTINIQERFSANVTDAGVITILEGFTLADVEIGDAIIINNGGSTNYKSGGFYYRKSTQNGNMNDFSELVRDISSATKDQVTAGTVDNLYITPASLNGSAPILVGTNFSNIPGSAINVATSSAFGVLKVTTGNGIDLTSGVLKINQASTSAFGTIKVTTGNGLSLSSGVLSLNLATASNAGSVKLSGKGITAGSDGSFNVSLSIKDNNTLEGDGVNNALGVKINSTSGGLSTDSNGIKVNVDGTLLTIENNKIVNKAVSETRLQQAIQEALQNAATKQVDIQVVAGDNYINSTITTIAPAVPRGLRRASDGKFLSVNPSTIVVSGGNYTCSIDVTGLTALDTNTWYVVF